MIKFGGEETLQKSKQECACQVIRAPEERREGRFALSARKGTGVSAAGTGKAVGIGRGSELEGVVYIASERE